MTTRHPSCDVGLDRLVDYLLDELPSEDAEALEEHLFLCSRCAARAESIDRLAAGVAEAARHAVISAVVAEPVVARARADGLTMREYRIPDGGFVACSAGPEDLTVVRLAADYRGAADLELEVVLHDLKSGATAPPMLRPVVADLDRGEVVLVFPGAVVRGYPRSRWSLRVLAASPAGPSELGRFEMDHTPEPG